MRGFWLESRLGCRARGWGLSGWGRVGCLGVVGGVILRLVLPGGDEVGVLGDVMTY